MIIKKDKLSWKAYVFFCYLWDIWWNKGSIKTSHNAEVFGKIGLCEYGRMLFIWGPLMVTCYLAFFYIVLATFVINPILYGFPAIIGIGVSLSVILTAAIIGIAVFAFIGLLIKSKEIITDKVEAASSEEKEPNFLFEYVKAVKNKICPVMEIKE